MYPAQELVLDSLLLLTNGREIIGARYVSVRHGAPGGDGAGSGSGAGTGGLTPATAATTPGTAVQHTADGGTGPREWFEEAGSAAASGRHVPQTPGSEVGGVQPEVPLQPLLGPVLDEPSLSLGGHRAMLMSHVTGGGGAAAAADAALHNGWRATAHERFELPAEGPVAAAPRGGGAGAGGGPDVLRPANPASSACDKGDEVFVLPLDLVLEQVRASGGCVLAVAGLDGTLHTRDMMMPLIRD